MKPISVYICIPICLCIFRLLSLSLCIIYYCYYYYSFHSCSVEVEIVILFYILGIFRCWICVYDFLLWLIVFFATSVLIADTSFHTHIYLRIQLYECTSIFIVVSQSVCKGKKNKYDTHGDCVWVFVAVASYTLLYSSIRRKCMHDIVYTAYFYTYSYIEKCKCFVKCILMLNRRPMGFFRVLSTVASMQVYCCFLSMCPRCVVYAIRT